MTAPMHECWAVVAPGFEKVAAQELVALGFVVDATEVGGVTFRTDDAGLLRANRWLRSATRVLVRIARFKVTAFHELERLAKGVAWRDFVRDGGAASLRVTCKKSRLYHSDAVAERLATAIARQVNGVRIDGTTKESDEDDAPDGEAQSFVVRLQHDVCTINADSSGALLHRRGYRLATAKAPMRETLAAGLLLALGYDGTEALIDPMCGSGTIPIEAALLARGIAPGARRSFACEQWPSVPPSAFDGAKRDSAPRADRATITASDRDAGAIEATRANAERAGVADAITIKQQALSAMTPTDARPLVLVNPPYGARVGEAHALRDLYASLGNVVRAACPGGRLAILSAESSLDAQVKLPFREVLRFKNGGIPVRLLEARIPTRG
jgi:putative N6-adenine-specific DNA methylase